MVASGGCAGSSSSDRGSGVNGDCNNNSVITIVSTVMVAIVMMVTML